jgi:hypothetical protein
MKKRSKLQKFKLYFEQTPSELEDGVEQSKRVKK